MKIAKLIHTDKLYSVSDRSAQKGQDRRFIAQNKGERGWQYVKHEIEKEVNTIIEYCTIDSAHKYDFVLVTLTSNYDILNFVYETLFSKKWKERKFKVIAGGAGVINIYSLIEVVDYVFFGRAENLIGEIAKNGFDYEHESYLKISDGIKEKKLRQPQFLLKAENIKHGEKLVQFNEKFTGCAQKCFYCHYTFSRKLTGRNTYHIDIGDNTAGHFIEIEQMKIEYFNPKVAYYLIAIDGNNEKIRNIYNRKLKDIDIVNFIQHASKNTQCNGLVLKTFSILGMETENYNDSQKMVEMFAGIKNIKTKVNIKLKFTPFRPSYLTPSEYAKIDPFNIEKYYPVNQSWTNICTYYSSDKIKIFSDAIPQQFKTYISDIAITRCTEKTYLIFKNVILNPKFHSLKQNQAKAILEKQDINDWIREYDVNEQLPTWYLQSYIPREKIKKMRLQMKRKMLE
jgi:hypothetical protein